jgi:hypothetical protein
MFSVRIYDLTPALSLKERETLYLKDARDHFI